MTDLGLVIRPMVAADIPYVARSWLMALTERDEHGKRRRGYQRRRAYDAATPRVARMLERCLVWCAVAPSAPATVHGFVVVTPDHRVEFLYVPREMRHNGIEALLFSAAQPAADESGEPCNNVRESKRSCSEPPSPRPAAA